jgi:hypothetical protein
MRISEVIQPALANDDTKPMSSHAASPPARSNRSETVQPDRQHQWRGSRFRSTRSIGKYLTTAQGLRLPDTDHSLKAGERGPSLIEDFHLREKITHFDHERIPQRVVHARGATAHGVFESYGTAASAIHTGQAPYRPTVSTTVSRGRRRR